jgi:diguanylate cyclase (GGDEF)-like protein/PAS domain S-box-containing protein
VSVLDGYTSGEKIGKKACDEDLGGKRKGRNVSGEIKNIRLRLLIAFLLPVFGLLYFSAGQVYDKFTIYQKSHYLEQVVHYVEYAAKLTRELQKERGLSLGFLAGKNPDFFGKALKAQRQMTDRAFMTLNRFLWQHDTWQGEKEVKNFLRRYAQLPKLRKRIDDKAIPSMEAFSMYGTIIRDLLLTTETLGTHFINESFSRTIKNFEELLYLSEVCGKERALIASLLEAGQKKASLQNRLISLEKECTDLKQRFFKHATVHTLQIFNRYVDPELEQRFESVRRQIIFGGNYSLIDSSGWWKLSTRYINALYRVDFALLEHLGELKDIQKNNAIRTLWISVILWILFVAFLYGLLLYILRIIHRFGRAIQKSEEETRLHKAFAEFSEYLVFYRDERVLLNALPTLLSHTERFRYLWLGRCEGEKVHPLFAENISLAVIEEELRRRRKETDRLHHAILQIAEEKHPLHFVPNGEEHLLDNGVGELGFFPVLRQKSCQYLLVVALPEGRLFDTFLLDLLQKMCNSLGTALEMIEVERQEKRLEEELRIAATAFNAHEAITITDANGKILQVNDAFTQITGYSAEEAIGKNPNILKSGRHEKEFYVQMWDQIRKEGFWKGEIYNRRKNGEVYPEMLSISSVRNDEGEITHYVAHFFDITEIKDAQKDAEYRAQHDALTNLYNRQKLTEELEKIYLHSLRSGEYNAFLYLDLDNFKHINDFYNHEMGDRVLIEVARRLEQLIHGEDMLARIAGDEFALILCCLGNDRRMATKKTSIVVEKIRHLFNRPIVIDGVSFEITFSMGIKVFPDSEREWKEVMINADVAMYHAKKSGKNRYNFFDEKLDLESKNFLQMKNDLSRALKEKELVVHYQPRIEIASGKIVGMEALIRWEHPQKGLLFPDEFLYVSQGNNLGFELNEYVLEEVCRQIETWRKRSRDFSLKVSVNISGEQFNSSSYIDSTLKRLKTNPDIARFLEFEIVEDALLQDIDHTVAVIREFKKLGVGFCMDDFGTGYSSIEYLKRLPVDIVKIDRGFILDLFEDRNDEVVKLIVKTAEIFGMHTVAEGVERREALDFLREIGCDYYQGYYFSPPVPAEKIENLFQDLFGE